MQDFSKIDYLLKGNMIQRAVFAILNESPILDKLKAYNPILVGSIPLMINVENSDVDLICSYNDRNKFTIDLIEKFGNEQAFNICQSEIYGQPTVTAAFLYDEFSFEIFGQNIPTNKQLGYRHLIIEDMLLESHGPAFRQEVIELKRKGLKTEPAFCKILGITGNPYLEILKLEK